MSISISLDILLALSGCLALIGLGGAVASWARVVRKSQVTITVDVAGRGRQAVAFPANSPVIGRLAEHLREVDFSPVEDYSEDEVDRQSNTKRWVLNRVALVLGAVAAVAGTFPLLGGELAIQAAVVVSALTLTRFGEILSPLMKLFAPQNRHRFTTGSKATIILALFTGEEARLMRVGRGEAAADKNIDSEASWWE